MYCFITKLMWSKLASIVIEGENSYCKIYANLICNAIVLGRVVQTAAYLKGTIGGPVDFQCTYTLGEGEKVISGLILWQVETQPSVYENIAAFSPPGGPPPRFISSDSSLKLKNRTELLNVTDMGSNTFKVVMRLREVECIDENKYRCSVTFIDPSVGPVLRTAGTIFTVQGEYFDLAYC